MEFLLLILGFICVCVGVIGSLLPVLPGPTISWFGILLLYFIPEIEFNYWVVGITFMVAIGVAVLDYVIPAKGTKRFGGSRYGIWGTNIGLIVGFMSPIPFGFIIGPFVGALIGELLYNSNDTNRALKAATGSFIGFVAGTFFKFIISIIYFGLFIYIFLNHSNVWHF